MKKQKIMLMLLTILAFCMVMTGTAGAQDIDIDNMDNEQLLILLQQIMDKLEQQETAEVTEVPTAETAVPEAAEPVIELKKFRIYENKKLIIGRMPDSYFIQPSSGDDGGDDNDDHDTDDPGSRCDRFCYWDDSQRRCVCPKG